MSILIKGVEMPSKCWSCPCCVDNGLIGRDREYFCSALDSDFEIDNLEQRLSACPFNEVPTPHGRLIDADRLLESIKTNFYEHFGSYDSGQELLFDLICDSIEDSLTIIEAEVCE